MAKGKMPSKRLTTPDPEGKQGQMNKRPAAKAPKGAGMGQVGSTFGGGKGGRKGC